MNLKIERERNNYTQKQLADLIEKDRTLISKIESEVTSPSVETAKKIASILGFDWVLFFSEKCEKTSP